MKKLDRSTEVPGTVAALVFGILEILVMLSAYPLYRWMTKRGREKVAEEIIALSEELSAGEQIS